MELDKLLSIAQKGMKTYQNLKNAAKIIETGDIGLAFTKIIGQRFNPVNTKTPIDAKPITDDSTVSDKLSAINQNSSNTALFAEQISQNMEILVEAVDSQKESMANLGMSIVKEIKTLEKVLDSQNEEGEDIMPGRGGGGGFGGEDEGAESGDSGVLDKFKDLLGEEAKNQLMKKGGDALMKKLGAPSPAPAPSAPPATPPPLPPAAGGASGVGGAAEGIAATGGEALAATGGEALAATGGEALAATAATTTGTATAAAPTVAAGVGGVGLLAGGGVLGTVASVALPLLAAWAVGKIGATVARDIGNRYEQETQDISDRSQIEADENVAKWEYFRHGFAEEQAAQIVDQGQSSDHNDVVANYIKDSKDSLKIGLRTYQVAGIQPNAFASSWNPAESPIYEHNKEVLQAFNTKSEISSTLRENLKTSAIAIESDDTISPEDKEKAYRNLIDAAISVSDNKELALFYLKAFKAAANGLNTSNPKAARELLLGAAEIADAAQSRPAMDEERTKIDSAENIAKSVDIGTDRNSRDITFAEYEARKNAREESKPEEEDQENEETAEPGETSSTPTEEDQPEQQTEENQTAEITPSEEQTSTNDIKTEIPQMDNAATSGTPSEESTTDVAEVPEPTIPNSTVGNAADVVQESENVANVSDEIDSVPDADVTADTSSTPTTTDQSVASASSPEGMLTDAMDEMTGQATTTNTNLTEIINMLAQIIMLNTQSPASNPAETSDANLDGQYVT